MTALQLVGLILAAGGALLLAMRSLSRFRLPAAEEARTRWDEDYVVGTIVDDDQEEREIREEYLPEVRRERAVDLLGAVLLLVGFVFQGLGIAFGI